MKIESSNISLAASSSQKTVHQKNESLRVWKDGEDNPQPQAINAQFQDFIKKIADLMKDSESGSSKISSTQASDAEFGEYDISEEDKNKIRLINRMLEAITGKKVRFFIPKKFMIQNDAKMPTTYAHPAAVNAQTSQQRQGWGIDYQSHERYEENATMSFQANGSVTTADGRSVSITLNLDLQRSYVQESHLSFKAGDALIDPLVINFDAASAELSASKYAFDINQDGKPENISFTKTGSGFLAFDRNLDGQINNGGELFGPSTGNGFMELSQFDEDGNNWIDENDSLFKNLQIWTKDENGKDQLFAIGEKGIGAIYLGAVQSAYALKTEHNDTLGQIQQTGIYLKENGTAGTIQHVDLKI